MRGTAAAVFYLVTGMNQDEVAEIFNVSSATIRNNLRRYNLISELFIERARKYLSEEKIQKGLKMKMRNLVDAAVVFCMLSDLPPKLAIKEACKIFQVYEMSVRSKLKKLVHVHL
jgi:hypothetical protein